MEIKLLDTFTAPVKPPKRELTGEEEKYLYQNFNNFSWSPPDKFGRIILGGGDSEYGVYYITLIDLELAIKTTPNYTKGYIVPSYSTSTTTTKSSWSKLGVKT